jgi:MFS transporter, DHA1 family, multidrug resistance protein
MYGFNLGQTGLAFLSVAVGATLSMIIFDATYHFFVEKDIIKNPTKVRPQESSLQPALLCAMSLTGALFLFGMYYPFHKHSHSLRIDTCCFCVSSIMKTTNFPSIGWTADPSIHWIVSLIGISLFTISAFILNLSIFVYLPMSYPQYAASIFAANDAVRSSVAAGAIHFAQPLYRNLGVGKGTSVLGGVSVLGIVGIWVLYFYGAQLRARSRFAVKP